MKDLALQIIQDEVEREFKFKLDFTTRQRQQVYARSICYVLSRDYTAKSLKQIGIFFGGLDHATVLHGLKKSHNEYRLIPAYRSKLLRVSLRVSEFFPDKPVDSALLKEARNYDEAVIKAEKYKSLYEASQLENRRLKGAISSKSIADVDYWVSKLDDAEIEELKTYRIIPFLKMRGKLTA